MAEIRFRNTALSREAWYRKLKPAFKCVWEFICDECDKAGMWTVDVDALEFFIGEPIDFNQFMIAVNADRDEGNQRVEWYNNKKKVWVTGFTAFQYGELSSNCKPHEKIILLLNSYMLLHRVPVRVHNRVIDTLQERKGKEGKGNVLESNEEKEPELFQEPNTPPPPPPKAPRTPNILPEADTQTDEKRKYKEEILSGRDNIDDKALKIKIADYIREKKPAFIEAYMDLWNLSAIGNRLATTKTINTGRLNKFRTRIKEPAFDFVKILEEIKQSGHLRGENGHNWKVTFDWVLENDSNYVKIIEGQYRNKN